MTHPLQVARDFVAKERDSFIAANTTSDREGGPDLSTLDDDARDMLEAEFDPALKAIDDAMAAWPGPPR